MKYLDLFTIISSEIGPPIVVILIPISSKSLSKIKGLLSFSKFKFVDLFYSSLFLSITIGNNIRKYIKIHNFEIIERIPPGTVL